MPISTSQKWPQTLNVFEEVEKSLLHSYLRVLSITERETHTFCPSGSCRSGSCLMLSPLPTFPLSLLLKVFPLRHPMCPDLFSRNLILHGSFSLQRLTWTFHFYPLFEGVKCISDWTGYTRWSQPFLCCSRSAAWQDIPLQRHCELWV